MDSNWGKYIIVFGLFVVIAGIIIYFFHDKLTWIGRLPGDIRVERPNVRFYFPLATMLVLSLLLTLIINIVKRWI